MINSDILLENEILQKDIDSTKKKTPKSIKRINTITDEPHMEINKGHPEDNTLRELKLNIKRIDETNYVSILSPHSLKMISEKDNKSPNNSLTTPKKNLRKSIRWSERNENDVMNLVEELMNDSSDDEISNTPKKHFQKVSESFSTYSSSESSDEKYEILNTSNKRTLRSSISSTLGKSNREVNTPKRLRKQVSRFGESVDMDELELLNTPPENKPTRKTSVSSSTLRKSNSDINTPECITPKRLRKPVSRFGESVDVDELELLNTPPENKRTRKTSVSSSTLRRSNRDINTPECITPKRLRKPVSRFGESVDVDKLESVNTPPENERTQKTSISSSNRSNHKVNTLECVTPKRTRKSVCRYSELDSNKIEVMSGKIDKKTISFDNDEDMDFEIDVWKTPVNKQLRKSMTSICSGSNVRRSLLQDIPEYKEIITPNTPRKTPKAHVKNLTASASKRLDSGARVPYSPLEKARANLHLHAAPKHLPCREVEFKSIYSFLARKINDELTGSMYISGVPGTGKTATVKRVIDSLNADLIMKHSFKFIEINGLRLANPHQAFSVIWKELTTETVSSSRAQALLNNFFSGKETRKLSTILLVDEVDHICNRKQDVVYNILDWPSRTGSKVVVITIANTMDLPERVLRGCVTSRMGLTRIVFKPYTFQQLQEIIMNRLIGNSSFDPDAVQLVARKVAAISGDARRALDICRRAIDLIKSEDSQFITINHVNEVLNSILLGVRVTAIRNCSVLEQYFLRALGDETTRTGFDHSTIDSVYIQMKSICLLEGVQLPNDQQIIMMAYRLRDGGLIFMEKKRCDIFSKVTLNVSPEDISYALDKYNI